MFRPILKKSGNGFLSYARKSVLLLKGLIAIDFVVTVTFALLLANDFIESGGGEHRRSCLPRMSKVYADIVSGTPFLSYGHYACGIKGSGKKYAGYYYRMIYWYIISAYVLRVWAYHEIGRHR